MGEEGEEREDKGEKEGVKKKEGEEGRGKSRGGEAVGGGGEQGFPKDAELRGEGVAVAPHRDDRGRGRRRCLLVVRSVARGDG